MSRLPVAKLETQLIHAGELRPRVAGAATLPIFQCTVFETGEQVDYHDIRYPRLSNLPNHRVLGDKLAALEGGEAGLVTASGMSAIASTLLSVLSAGDHLLAQNGLYGGSHDLVTTDLPDFGIEVDFIDGDDPASWESRLKPNTRAIYVESMTNPLLQVADHRAVVDFARQHGLSSIIDNTFASPVNFRPLRMGFDLSVHSATKFLNGHSDLVAGAVIGSTERVSAVKRRVDHLGGSLDPHSCFLLARGLKTLALRVAKQNQSALEIARHLAARPDVAIVNYPGLESHPAHDRARELFDGYGGMLSFELTGAAAAAEAMIPWLTLPCHAPSLGGVETLITRPANTTHAGMSAADRERVGIRDGLLRLSVGIEDTGDLIADLDRALAGDIDG